MSPESAQSERLKFSSPKRKKNNSFESVLFVISMKGTVREVKPKKEDSLTRSLLALMILCFYLIGQVLLNICMT